MSDSVILAVKKITIRKGCQNFATNSREKFQKNNLATVRPYCLKKPQRRKEGLVIEPHMTNILRYTAWFKICSVTLFIYKGKNNKVGRPDNLFRNESR